METVTIGCRLPNGYVLEVGLETTVRTASGGLATQIRRTPAYARFVLEGTHGHTKAARLQGILLPSVLAPEPFINRNVPKALWDQWKKDHPNASVLKAGYIFEVKDDNAASIKAATIDASAKAPQPLAPIDPSKPFAVGPDKVETADHQKPIVVK